jgi:beta-phosphoglucomutase-like phosphatase (HAD superfamily)
VATLFVFDLDGVLIDSRQAVEAAYRDAGVEMPSAAWGLPWQSWLIDLCGSDEKAREVHALKNELYPQKLLEHAQRLPAADIVSALWFMDPHQVRIITGASDRATLAVLEVLNLNRIQYACGLTSQDKTDILRAFVRFGYNMGMYFDDRDDVQIPEGWTRVKVTN